MGKNWPILFEALEPRIMLSADGLLNVITPDQDQDALPDGMQDVIQHAELLETQEQFEEQVISDTSNNDNCRPILTLFPVENTNDESANADLSVDNIGPAQTGEIALLSNDFDGDIESKVGTTEDGSTPTYVNDGEISVEETLSIEIRGPPASETADSEITTSSYIDNEESEADHTILDEHAAKSQPDGTVNLPGLELVDRNPDNLQDQIIYLDFEGAEDVVCDGSVIVGPFDAAFKDPVQMTGREQAIKVQVVLDAVASQAASATDCNSNNINIPFAVAPLSVVLVSDAIAQAEQIQGAAAKDTIAIIYDADAMTTSGLVDLLVSLSAVHNGVPIGHLGIVAHGGPGELDLGMGDSLNLATLPSQAAALEQLWSVLTNDARLDLYACSVAAGTGGKTFVDEFAAATGAAVFASDDPIGTVPGADFVWEYQMGQTAVSNELFSIQEIEKIPRLCLADVTLTLYVRDGSTTGPVLKNALVAGEDGAGVSYRQLTNDQGFVTITGAAGTWDFTVSGTSDTSKTDHWAAQRWPTFQVSATPTQQTETVYLSDQLALGMDEVANYAQRAFRGSKLVIALAVAAAESSGYVGATNVNSKDPQWANKDNVDRGLWQINGYWHPKYSSSDHGTLLLTDPYYNAAAAYDSSGGGTDWRDWVTFYTDKHYKVPDYEGAGPYLDFLDEAIRAASAIDPTVIHAIGDPVFATHDLNVRDTPGGTLQSQQRKEGDTGVITGWYQTARIGQSGKTWIWWQVRWSDGQEGWSVQDYLERIVMTIKIDPRAATVPDNQPVTHTVNVQNLAMPAGTTVDLKLEADEGGNWVEYTGAGSWNDWSWTGLADSSLTMPSPGGSVSTTYSVTNKGSSDVLEVRVTATVSWHNSTTSSYNWSTSDHSNDHPDETYDVGCSQFPTPWKVDTQSSIGVLLSGNGAGIGHVLGRYNIAAAPVKRDLTILGETNRDVMDLDVLLIGSAGLTGLDSSPMFCSMLDHFVASGGTVVALTQQRGYEFDVLPGELAGYGWNEDQSCHSGAVEADEQHPMIAGQPQATVSANVDGFFSAWPSNSEIVLDRTKNGMPALLTYPYGEGCVIATTLYSDWAYGHGQTSDNELQLIRDIVDYAVNWRELAGRPEVYYPGSTVAFPLPVTNEGGSAVAYAELGVIDPDRNLVGSYSIPVDIQPGQSGEVPLSYDLSPAAKCGIWTVRVTLLDADGNAIDERYATEPFVVSALGELEPVESDLSFFVTADAEYFAYGSPAHFTFHVRNNGIDSQTVTVAYYLVHHFWRTGDTAQYGGAKPQFWETNPKVLQRKVTVEQGEETAFVYTPIVLCEDRLRAGAYDSSGRCIGGAGSAVYAVVPQVDLAVNPAGTEFVPGATIPVEINVRNQSSVDEQDELTIRLLDPMNRVVETRTLSLNVGAKSELTESLVFSLSREAQSGVWMISADFGETSHAAATFAVPVLLSVRSSFTTTSSANDARISCTLSAIGGTIADGVLAAQILDPTGQIIWSSEQSFDAIEVNESRTVEMTAVLAGIHLGDYTLVCTASTTGIERSSRIKLPCSVAASVVQTGCARMGELLPLKLSIRNTGCLSEELEVLTQIRTFAFGQTDSVILLPGESKQIVLDGTVPVGTPRGAYDVEAALTLGNSQTVFVGCVSISAPPAPSAAVLTQEVKSGQPLALRITNPASYDTNCQWSMTLVDALGNVVTELADNSPLPAQQFEDVFLPVPGCVTSGIYVLSVHLFDELSHVHNTQDFAIKVVGPRIDMSLSADAAIYASGATPVGQLDLASETSLDGLVGRFSLLLSVADWARTYGGISDDQAQCIQQTADSGYIAAGYTCSFGAGGSDLWVVKLNPDGSVDWEKTYGGAGNEWSIYHPGYSIRQTVDGGYIVAGETDSFGAGAADMWILKLNSDGSIAWQNAYGGGAPDSASSIRQTADGGYIVAGLTESFGAGCGDFWVLKLNSDGTIAWQNTYGISDHYERAYSVEQTADGGYIVAGDVGPTDWSTWDTWVLKLNPDGSIAWQKTYDAGAIPDLVRSIQQTADGGYVLAGHVTPGPYQEDIRVLKLDVDGMITWQKTYGGSADSDYARCIQQTRDGGYIVAGETWQFGAGWEDAWVLRLGSDGDVLWQKTYGGTAGDAAHSIQQTTDDGFIMGGRTRSFGAGSLDFWVVKTDENGDIPDGGVVGISDATVSDASAIVEITSVIPEVSAAIRTNTTVVPQDTTCETSVRDFLSCWKFDEGTGTIAHDCSPYGADATIHGAAWAQGISNQGLRFDGVDDYVDISAIADDISRFENTIELWVTPTSDFTSDTQFQAFYAQWHRHYIGYGSGSIFARVCTAETWNSGYSAASYYLYHQVDLAAGSWHHVVLTFKSGDRSTLYVDGQQVDEAQETTGLGLAFYGYVFSLGRRLCYVPDGYFHGSIDEVAVYNRVLSEQEIQQHYQDGLGGPGDWVVWQYDITPIDLQAGVPQTYRQQLPALSETGLYRLTADLICSTTGQVIATAATNFLVTEAEVAVLLQTDSSIYKPDGQVAVKGSVINRTPADLNSVVLDVCLDSVVVYSETLDLLAGETRTFSFTTVAGEEDGILTASLRGPVDFETSLSINVETPTVQMTLDVPGVVSRGPFAATLTLENTSGVLVDLMVDFVGQQQAVTIPAGQTWMQVESIAITDDTTVTATITGDVTDEVSAQVVFGEDVALQIVAEPDYLAGLVAIPYTVTNNGQFDSAIEITFSLTNQPDRAETIVVPTGQAVVSELVYDLPVGDYTLDYSQPFGQGSVSFRVLDGVEITMDLSTQPRPEGQVEAMVTVRNTGPLEFSGFLSLGVSFWAIDDFLDLGVGQEKILIYAVPTVAAEPGEYTLEAIVRDDLWNPVMQQTAQITVTAADIQLVSVPEGLEFDAGAFVELGFSLRNLGGQAGRAEVELVFETLTRSQLVWLEPGEEQTVSFSAFLPEDMEGKQYYARLMVNDVPTDIPLKINGVKIQVVSALDQNTYTPGDTAHLNLTVTNVGLVDGVDLFAKVNCGDFEQTKPFILTDQQQLIFDIPVDIINGQKLAYGIYFDSGRSLWLDSRYLRSTPLVVGAVSLVTDKDVYIPGGTVNVMVLTDQVGTLAVEAPGFSGALQVAGDSQFSFILPGIMTQGTFFVNWVFGEQQGALPFDVAGLLVRILECRLDKPRYYPTQDLNTTLLLDFGQQTDAKIIGQILRPDGTSVGAFEIIDAFEAGLATVECSGIVESSLCGIHRLYYQIIHPTSGLLLAAGAEAFDVGDGSIVSLKTDKPEYLMGEEITATIDVVGHNAEGILQLYIDSEQVWQQQVQLSGYQDVEAQISGITTGSHVLKAVLAIDGLSNSREVSFSVTSNNPPVALDDTYVVDEDTTLTTEALQGVMNNDSDPNGDLLTAMLVSNVSHGILELNEDGSFEYMPDLNFYGSDSFTYYANDGVLDSNIATVNITVNPVNDVPLITDLLITSQIDENSIAVLTVQFTDPDALDSHSVVIDWADSSSDTLVLAVGDRSFSAEHQYLDDEPSGTAQDDYLVDVIIADADGGSGSASFIVTVNNLAPEITEFSSDATLSNKGSENEDVAVFASFVDIGKLDTHTAEIHWGDGVVTQGTLTESTGVGTVSASHVYAFGGIYTISLILEDDDSGVAQVTTTAVITGVGIHNGQLQVIGTDAKDKVSINLVGGKYRGKHHGDNHKGKPKKQYVRVHANFLPKVHSGDDDDEDDNGGSRFRDFDADAVSSILMVLCDGDDHAKIAGNIALDAIIDGGHGRDKLKGGAGNDIVLGGAGNDKIQGGRGADILIGGLGSDRLVGNKGDDILIGDPTVYDSDQAEDKLADFEALLAILDEWTSEKSFAERRDNISGENPSDDRLNDGFFLAPGVTVWDDGERDKLTGSSGEDWFILSGKDKGTDLHKHHDDDDRSCHHFI